MNRDPSKSPLTEERVYFENRRELGCQVIVDGKEVLSLTTPESSLNMASCPVFSEDWTTPDEFCLNLSTVLRAFGASEATLLRVEGEMQVNRQRAVAGPIRSSTDFLREIDQMVKAV
jgi:hypothetical protein